MKTLRIFGFAWVLAIPPLALGADHSKRVQSKIDTISQYTESHPEMAIDLREQSGEFCFNTWKVGGGHMTHYAVDPSSTTEDMIDFVIADSMKGAIDVNKLPRLPGKLGAMKPNQWYYLPAGQFEPHHGTRFPFAMLMRATDIK